MQYNLPLNLQQRAALKIVTSFWERKEIQDKVREFFKFYDKIETKEEEWCKLTNSVVDELNKVILPINLKKELIYIMKMTGEKMLDWYQHIKSEYKKEKDTINYIDKIYWTPYGTIDEVKILKSSWLKNPNLDITKVYYFACTHALESHINDVWHEISEDIRGKCCFESFMCMDQHIMTYWEHCRNNNLPKLMRTLKKFFNMINLQRMRGFHLTHDQIYDFNHIYYLSHSAEENMLRLSIYRGYYMATKYFWEKLTENKRNKYVVEYAMTAIIRCYDREDHYEFISGYKRSQYVEICIFLMNQMTESHKKTFFNTQFDPDEGLFDEINEVDVKDEILRMLLLTWPWQDLFIPVLKDMLQYVDHNSRMSCMFLRVITCKINGDYDMSYFTETNKYQCLLREAWLIIPAFIKQKMVEEDSSDTFICNLINMWDLDSLNLILNDPAIAAVRNQFIDFGLDSYNRLIEQDEFEKLDQLIEKLFKFEKEKKCFKQQINPWYNLLIGDKFDLADKLLDWQSSTSEERQSLKNNINHMEFCKTFIQNDDYELLDKFLDWKFEKIEERIKCENHFKSDIFAIRQVYNVWRWANWYVDDSKQKSSRFLNWVFESNEEITCFKQEKLTNFEIDQSIIDGLVMLYKDGVIDEFLSWCLLDDRKIQWIKQAVSEQNQRPA